MNFSNERNPGKNFTGMIVVVLLHVLVAYGIVTGLGKRLVTKMTDVVEAKLVEEVKPPPVTELPPPPPPPPAMKAPPPPFIPPVEVNVPQPPPQQNVIANASTTKPATTELQPTEPAAPPAPPAPPAPAPVKSVHIPAVADFGSCDKPEYPRLSRRNEETGTVTVSFLIGIDGRIVDSKIMKSSGFRELDKATLLGIGKCKFKPGMTDGKPEQSWMQVQYVWTLE